MKIFANSTEPSGHKEASHAPYAPAAARLRPGLSLISTPIGNARDITLRALDALNEADALAAEDGRALRRLMDMHGLRLNDRPLIAYHEHNSAAALPRLMGLMDQGARLVYASEAGTPLISDPGYRLVEAALAGGHEVWSLPGPCAAPAALSISGLPSDQFHFAGFPPAKSAARRRFLLALAPLRATLIFYESPHRVAASLADMAAVFGPRPAAAARELTKLHEECRRAPLPELAAHFLERGARGEFVILVGPGAVEAASAQTLDDALAEALETLSLKDAAAQVATRLNLKKRDVYARALELRHEGAP